MTNFIDDNGNELEYDGRDFGITKQCVSFLDFKIKGDVSINLKIPSTAHNKKVLGYFNSQQIDSLVFSQNPFSVYRNGNFMFRGYLMIQQDFGDYIECFFISGNSNWIALFNFSCKEIRDDLYSLYWQSSLLLSTAENNRNNDHGIVFPIIDYFGEGTYGQALFAMGPNFDPTTFGQPNQDIQASTMLPCLYIHTLVEQLSKVSGVKIVGNLLTDPVYKSLIITPESPELIDPATQTKINEKFNVSSYPNNIITIGAIAPDLPAIDIIRYLCFSFGCIPTYDATSNELSLDLTNKIKIEDAEDWSSYVKSYEINFKNTYSKIFIKNKQNDDIDDDIAAYNTSKEVKYGDLMIETDNTSGSQKTVYESKFLPSKSYINRNTSLRLLVPFVKLYEMSDIESIPYTSVTSAPGLLTFNLSTAPADVPTTGGFNSVCEIIDGNNRYSGHFITNDITTSTITISNIPFIGTSSGTIILKKLSPKKTGARILRCKTNVTVSDVMTTNKIYFQGASATGVTTASIAWYSNPTGYPSVSDETSISYGDINVSGFGQITLGENYLQTIIGFLKSSPIRVKMLLPESKFISYNFNKWIYINIGDINGYFFVHKIENFTDAQNEVNVDLLRIF